MKTLIGGVAAACLLLAPATATAHTADGITVTEGRQQHDAQNKIVAGVLRVTNNLNHKVVPTCIVVVHNQGHEELGRDRVRFETIKPGDTKRGNYYIQYKGGKADHLHRLHCHI